MDDFSAQLNLKSGSILTFGKYPTEAEWRIIETNFGEKALIVDLCTKEEITWDKVQHPMRVIECPIVDGKSQTFNPKLFKQMVEYCVSFLKEANARVYIHCKGGHGRSAMVAAIILGKLESLSSREAISRVRVAHQQRITMNPKWRKLGAPQRAKQKRIISEWLD